MSKDKSHPQGELPEIKPVRSLAIHLLNNGTFGMEFPQNDENDFNTAMMFLVNGLAILNQQMARAKVLNQGRIVKPNLVMPVNLRPGGKGDFHGKR